MKMNVREARKLSQNAWMKKTMELLVSRLYFQESECSSSARATIFLWDVELKYFLPRYQERGLGNNETIEDAAQLETKEYEEYAVCYLIGISTGRTKLVTLPMKRNVSSVCNRATIVLLRERASRKNLDESAQSKKLVPKWM